ncbi:MAG: 50S ribosomal protein L25/general stress protein Ctc [Cryobacterium sp.]
MAKQINSVIAEPRVKFGKGAARKLRVLGYIPAVIYGHGTTPVHVSLPEHRIGLLLRKANAILEIDVNGTKQRTLVKDVQKDPFLQIIEHIDLIVLRKGQKVQVEVAVHTDGETFPGTMAVTDTKYLLLEVDATDIPENVTVNIEGLEDGAQIKASDVVIPDGASLITDPDTLVVLVVTPRGEDEDEEEAAE